MEQVLETSIDWSCRNKSDRLYPNAEFTEGWICYVVKIDNPFLQKLVDMKAALNLTQGEWTLYADKSMVMFHVYDGFINLECISTPVEERGKGSATKVMQAIIHAANETGTEIRLRACNVTGHGWSGLMNHIVVATGMVKKNKIPTAKLQKWYEKFGFVKVADAIHKGKKAGVNMVYLPKK